jgi:hypothetical protein
MNFTSTISSHCASCQETTTASRDHGSYYCTQCGERISTSSGESKSTSTTATTSSTSDSILGSLLNQALSQGATLTQQQRSPFDSDDVQVTEEMQARFQQLLPMFQQFMHDGAGGGDGLGFGFGGDVQGGAPPAAKTAVESLERITLDSTNMREVTQRMIVKVAPRNISDGTVNEGKGFELVSSPASFGTGIGVENTIQHARLVVADPVEMHMNDAPTNVDAMRGSVVVVKRGKCSFALKALRAEKAGAIAVLVMNTMNVWPFTMGDSKNEGGDIHIPSVMCRKDHSELLLQKMQTKEEEKDSVVEWCVTMKEDNDTRSCAVCQSDFENGDTCIRMPCPGFRHTFHHDCIMPWLNMRNTCPTCRYELPTDNKQWNKLRADERARESMNEEGLEMFS